MGLILKEFNHTIIIEVESPYREEETCRNELKAYQFQ